MFIEATGAKDQKSLDAMDKAYGEYMLKHQVQADGNIRPSDNWQKGIPIVSYMKSMWRHFLDLWTLHRSEDETLFNSDGEEVDTIDTLCSILFNVQGMLHEEIKKKRDFKTLSHEEIWKETLQATKDIKNGDVYENI